MKNFLRTLGYAVLVYILLSVVINKAEEELPVSEGTCEDQYTLIGESLDRLHQRSWDISSAKGPFCASYRSSEDLSTDLAKHRNKVSSDEASYHEYWGHIYSQLVAEGKEHLGFIIDSLQHVGQEKNLDRNELAELVVSFVQDIPYSYILSKECSTLENPTHPCVGNTYLGILSPVEFLHSLRGDCDTRSVLIYAIMEEMGFDPMIVISQEYAHAMLAVHMPAAGDHLSHNGKNYYFWETTAKNWPVGVLPPNSKNINYWKIALVNEL